LRAIFPVFKNDVIGSMVISFVFKWSLPWPIVRWGQNDLKIYDHYDVFSLPINFGLFEMSDPKSS